MEHPYSQWRHSRCIQVGDVVLGVDDIYLDPLALLKEFEKFTLLRITILRTQTTYLESVSGAEFLL